jgi:hypothetical protein
MPCACFGVFTHLMQFSGSFSQSVLHRKRCHDSQPMGGVLASPFSRPCTCCVSDNTPSIAIITVILFVHLVDESLRLIADICCVSSAKSEQENRVITQFVVAYAKIV